VTDIKCPKHDTGGGPCYCGKVPGEPVVVPEKNLRKYTLVTSTGGRIVTTSESLIQAIRETGCLDIVSSKSEPAEACAMSNCQSVYQHGNDQYVCTRCNCSWDRDDKAPVCKTNADLERETIDKLRAELSNAPKCQECFATESTMQRDDGTYCCGSCYQEEE